MASILVEIKANASEFAARMGEANAEVKKLSTEGSKNYAKVAAIGKAAFEGLAAGAIGLGTVSLELGDKLETSQTKLEQALKNSGSSFDDLKPQIDAVDARMQKLGFTNADTEAGLANLVTATHNPAESLKDLGLAADLARFKNVDLATASIAVAKAQEGQLRPLKALGIDLPISSGGAAALAQAQSTLAVSTQKLTTFLHAHGDAVKTSSKYHLTYEQMLDKVHAAQAKVSSVSQAGTTIMAALGKAIGGQATAASVTFSGKVAALKAQLEDTAAKIGLQLVPILERLATIVMGVVNWFEQHTAIAKALGIAIASILVPAMAVYVAGLISAAAAEIVALAPIILITAAVAALGVGIYELVTHWKTVWDFIKKITSDAWDWIKKVFDDGTSHIRPLITAVSDLIKIDIDIVKILADAFQVAWALISLAVRAAWVVIGPIVRVYLKGSFDVLKVALNVFKGIWSTTWSVITGVVKTAWSILRPILSTMASTLKTVTGAVSDVTGAVSKVSGGITGGLKHLVPHFAGGGVVKAKPGGTLALLAEGGQDEAIVPLDGSNAASPLPSVGSGTEGSLTVVSPIYLDGQKIAEVVTKYQRRANGRGVPVAAG